MKRSGSADLPLHYGYVPQWLAERMAKMGLAIAESVIADYGTSGFLRRISDPFWFQSFGAVMGMDWHSSGITTSVMGALKRSVNPHAKELGIYICGGKGKHALNTPDELIKYAALTGINVNELVRCSKLTAKVDSTAVQDGHQVYMHSFIVSTEGNWSVVQQGMSVQHKTARRYHWHSENIRSFVDEPHTAVCGSFAGDILNLTAAEAKEARSSIVELTTREPDKLLTEIPKLNMPSHHEVHAKDVDLKRLGAVLWLAQESQTQTFEELLLLKGLGPRTLQSLALVSEVIHGTPTRFKDPARFSFAHGGKDGHPFPVPVKVYDETISTLQNAVYKAKLGNSDKQEAIKKLHELSVRAEKDFIPENNFDALIEKERNDSWKYGGRTVFGKAKKPKDDQLKLF